MPKFNKIKIDKKMNLLNPTIRSLSILSCSSVVKGEIKIEDDMRIDGHVDGDIYSGGKVVVGPQGSVKGKISGKSVEVIGKIWGDVTVSDLVILRAPSFCKGQIITRSIEVEAGASFFGHCKMENRGERKNCPENNKIVSINEADI